MAPFRPRPSVPAAAFAALVILLFTALVAWRPEAASARGQDVVRLASGETISLATPAFIEKGKRYAFTWPGGGPSQTFIIKEVRRDGWVLVDVAEENVDPVYLPPGQIPSRWLNAALALSVQEMRPLIQ